MRPLATLGLGLAFGLVLASAAHAGNVVAALDGPPGETPPRVDVTETPVAVDPLGVATNADAMSDRAFARSTAVALPAGGFDLSMRTAVEYGSLASVAAGLGHNFELSASVGYGRQLGHDVGAGAKVMLARHPTWAASLEASWHAVQVSSNNASLLTGDFKISGCVADCGAMLTFGLGLTMASSDYDSQTKPMLELSAIFGTGLVRPLLEAVTLAGDENFGFAGLRFGGRHVGVDLGVGVVASSDNGNSDSGIAMMLGLGVRP